jgi:helicase MOV-10
MFHPHNLLGRFEDGIELVFQDATLNQRFTVVRRVRAEVGSKHELASLAPVAPYVRPKPKRFRAHAGLVDGIQVPFVSSIKWAVKLPRSRVPEHIRKTFESGSPEAQASAVKKEYLPKHLNAQTYPGHWATLLHVEEVQMT